ncbi:stationary-phase survival protein SurE [Desulfurispirillum indicum S5]|uniref:5'-nucleotidase SurE n=1 Tax=Desulfurispirillum indicum (strain ATCC BAA-1389 / DSM 22839 / S5) TaxID=653733 RepID=E6W3U3_DESIS|nr:5'/3'-nucleotidase SurE [Desulfurispirillum indicum]ADU65811.1 stationary-phase survival protein SurE [Desulfurispirillum indicum S5]
MHILITNDDGIFSCGLQALVDIFAPGNEVTVVAPDTERSAIGHAITISTPLWTEDVEFRGASRAYKTTGTPADCVKLALRGLGIRPDMVISGINKGPNCGSNIIYSGTVSAATEGLLQGIPSFAVSVDDYRKPNYNACHGHLRSLVERLLPFDTGRFLFNINLPSTDADRIQGVRITRQAVSRYRDVFEKRHCPRQREYWWLTGEELEHESAEETDWVAMKQNYISVTPVQFDLTDHESFQVLRNNGF